MIKGSLLIGLQHRKWFASHEAGELHWIRKTVLSAIICLTGNQAVSLLTSFYCKIYLVQHQWLMDEISQNMTFFPHMMFVAFFKCEILMNPVYESMTSIRFNLSSTCLKIIFLFINSKVINFYNRFIKDFKLALHDIFKLHFYLTGNKLIDIKENLLNSLSVITKLLVNWLTN